MEETDKDKFQSLLTSTTTAAKQFNSIRDNIKKKTMWTEKMNGPIAINKNQLHSECLQVYSERLQVTNIAL